MLNKQEFRLNFTNKKQIQTIAKEMLHSMEKGLTIQKIVGLSDNSLEEIYSLAYNYYSQGKYKESLCLFQLIAGASPSTYNYVFGLASCLHQLGALEEASIGFFMALNLEPENPSPAYYIMDCLLKQNLPEEADEFADITINLCNEYSEYQEMKERCKLIKKCLYEKK